MLEPEDDPEYWSTMGYSLLMQGKIDQPKSIMKERCTWILTMKEHLQSR
jgi:hypothetical protein